MTQKSFTPFRRDDPRPGGPRRIMTNVLRVSAFQFGNPGALLVLPKTHNPAPHMDY